ncbi:MAG: HEAT repeat domain-containing protein, partial [Treponema sp.]|nr:HEAT repeat domain-containing protein [Treponema sp.]
MKAFAVMVLLLLFAAPLFSEETEGVQAGETKNAGAGNAGAKTDGDAAASAQKSVEEQRLETIRYGTENEIASLIQTLKTENAVYFDDELIALVQGTLNRNILTGVFTFFGDRGKGGLEERALKAVTEWDGEANET